MGAHPRNPTAWTPQRLGVPPVGSGSCAPASSHGEEHLPACPQRRVPHEIRTTGETSQGRRVPGGGQGTGATACRQYSGAADAPGTAIAPAREGPARLVPTRMTAGGPTVTSIARRSTPCQAASVRGQSNQVLSEVLRAGRASTAGLSPLSTPDSILICSVNFVGVEFVGLAALRPRNAAYLPCQAA